MRIGSNRRPYADFSGYRKISCRQRDYDCKNAKRFHQSKTSYDAIDAMTNLNDKFAMQFEQLKLLNAPSKAAVITSILLATVLVYMQKDVIASSVILVWYFLIIVVTACRLAHIFAYQKNPAGGVFDTLAWINSFRFGVLVAGLIWGSSSFLMFPSNQPLHQMYLVFVIAGLSAGGAVSLSADLFSANMFSVIVILPLVARLFFEEHSLYVEMSVAALLYLGFLISSSRLINHNILENIHLHKEILENKEALRISNEWHHAIRDGAMDGFWLIDRQGKLLEVNKTYCQMSGYTEDELLTMQMPELESTESPEQIAAHLNKIKQKGEDRYESSHRRKDGSLYQVETSAQYWPINDGQFVIFLQDITKRKQATDEIEFLAFYDPLTQLPNRRLMFDRLKHALATCSRTGRGGALLYLDLDKFKKLNDYHGHAIGDLLLQQVANRLNNNLRQADTISRVARIGGDEFVVLLENLGDSVAEIKILSTIVGNKILQILNEPYQLAQHEFRTTVSIGIAVYEDQNTTCEDILKHADIAMYQAKQEGRNKGCFFDSSMLEVIQARIALETDLKQAIQDKQFRLVYQIQVDHHGKAVGAEALIRWQSPERGLLSPLHFIPLAEETDLIFSIGHWVLENACHQLMHWGKNSLAKHLTLSINVSAKQFCQVNFADQVNAMLMQYGVKPELLKLEITESILLDSLEEIIATMISLKEIGVQISLDDFGIGYSCLQYLKRLPIQQLKIDQSFVRDIVDDSNDLAIVSTIIAMAQHMGIPVIAEGVETAEQQQILYAKGCTNYQGYLFGKPVPIEQFNAALNQA